MADLSQVSDEDLLAARDGRWKDVSNEGLLAMRGMKTAGATQAAPQPTMNPILRKLGQAGRTIAAAAASLPDTALMVPKTLAGMVEYGVSRSPLKDGVIQKYANKIRTNPTMRDSVVQGVDTVTQDQLKPQGLAENIIMGGGELAFSAGAMGKGAEKVISSPGIKEAIRGILEPSQAVSDIASVKIPAPKLDKPIKQMTYGDVKKEAARTYKYAAEEGGVLKPRAANRFIDKMLKAAEPENARVRRAFKKGPISQTLDDIFEEYYDKHMTLDDVEALDQKLTEVSKGFYSKIEGAKPGYGEIKAVQKALRESVEESVGQLDVEGGKKGFEALKKATSLYAKSKRLEEIDDIVQKALDQEQPARALRRGFAKLERDKGFNRFSPEEQAVIKQIAYESMSDDSIKFLTSRLTGIIGIATGHPILGGALAAGGKATRELKKAGQLSKITKLEKLILKSAGLQTETAAANLTPKQMKALGLTANIVARGQFND